MLMNLLDPGLFAFVIKIEELPGLLLATLIFVAVGLIFFAVAFIVLDKALPFSVHKEIEEDQNTSLGIIIGSMMIGIAIIIAAAIHG